MALWSEHEPAGRIERSARQAIDAGAAALAAADRPLAIRHFERAFRLAPHDPAAALILASAIAPVDPARGEAVLEASIARHPKHRETHFGSAIRAAPQPGSDCCCRARHRCGGLNSPQWPTASAGKPVCPDGSAFPRTACYALPVRV
jgi:hypothetical protein